MEGKPRSHQGTRKGYRRHFSRCPKGCRYRRKLANPHYFYELPEGDHLPNPPIESLPEAVLPTPQSLPEAVVDLNPLPVSLPQAVVVLSKPVPESQDKPGLRLLSLFDGIGSGRICLDHLNIDCTDFFSSEIDPDALAVLQTQFKGNMIHLGPVQSITKEILQCIGPIHLLLGGCPCSDFSLVNHKRKNLGPGSSGLLFYEYARILDILKVDAAQNKHPFFFVFENTRAMETSIRVEISRRLQCNPVAICASLFKPMKRPRLYWGNVPCMEEVQNIPWVKPSLQFFLDDGREAAVAEVNTITSNSASQRHAKAGLPVLLPGGTCDHFRVVEEEKLFGFARSWTDCADLPKSKRRALLGRAWEIGTVSNILRPLMGIFREVQD